MRSELPSSTKTISCGPPGDTVQNRGRATNKLRYDGFFVENRDGQRNTRGCFQARDLPLQSTMFIRSPPCQ